MDRAVDVAEFPEPAHKVKTKNGEGNAPVRQEWEPDKSKDRVSYEETCLNNDAPKCVARVFCEHVLVTEEDARVFTEK